MVVIPLRRLRIAVPHFVFPVHVGQQITQAGIDIKILRRFEQTLNLKTDILRRNIEDNVAIIADPLIKVDISTWHQTTMKRVNLTASALHFKRCAATIRNHNLMVIVVMM